ncbi:uncharacterized protein EDB91DRAFT_1158949 [Suillus paluster]|uniref:uncharacterized protein n=1 Tax=Suillus paluster TaxID=48578 RepID=UPI001B86A715|nr:uncharacterized protein EDB91DRAFT_1158949 [Suillus paluster]KAG1729877.1 hypothetical protein EDB91DRAFT_1158949 [Suillus paluster]
MGLVTGFQTKVDPHVVFAGGGQLFSDSYTRKELPPGTSSRNSQFVRVISAWVFQETLRLHIDNVEDHRVK